MKRNGFEFACEMNSAQIIHSSTEELKVMYVEIKDYWQNQKERKLRNLTGSCHTEASFAVLC